MKVFISWSGKAAKELATGLKEILPKIMQGIDPLVSVDIKGGEAWLYWLDKALLEATAGIFCLSPASKESPWLLYEAGAMTHAQNLGKRARNDDAVNDDAINEKPLVIPIRLGLEHDEVDLPLNRFQSLSADLEGLRALVDRLLELDATKSSVQSAIIKDAVDEHWPQVEARFMNANEFARAERQQQSAALECIHPSTCLIRAQGRSAQDWSSELACEVAEFLALPENGGRKRVSDAVFAAEAKKCRDAEKQSLHVLYATEDSIKTYYSIVNNDWVNTEAPPRDGKGRRRLLVLCAENQGDKNYRDSVARIFEKLKNTCDLRVVKDRDLRQAFPNLLRDMGIFELASGQLKGFMAFSEFMTAKVFAQASGSCFIVSDQRYLGRLVQQFDEAWLRCTDDLELEGTKQIRDWAKEIDPIRYRWACSSSVPSRQAIDALFANEIPAIRVHHVATSDECDRFLEAASKFTPDNYQLEQGERIRKIGEPLFEYRHRPNVDEYFEAAAASRKRYDEICQEAGWDPVSRLQEQLRLRSGIDPRIATYKQHTYFAGLIRFTEDGTLTHVDFAKADAIGYSVDGVEGQVAWNLFLKAPSGGGYCRVYKSLWCTEYEQCRVSYGYKGAVTDGSPYFDIDAVKGDIVLFNCRNFHYVEESTDDDRVTVGSFLGRLPKQRYILWS